MSDPRALLEECRANIARRVTEGWCGWKANVELVKRLDAYLATPADTGAGWRDSNAEPWLDDAMKEAKKISLRLDWCAHEIYRLRSQIPAAPSREPGGGGDMSAYTPEQMRALVLQIDKQYGVSSADGTALAAGNMLRSAAGRIATLEDEVQKLKAHSTQPNCYCVPLRERLLAAEREAAGLRAAAEPFADEHVSDDAACHIGITTKEKCGRCGRILALRAALHPTPTREGGDTDGR